MVIKMRIDDWQEEILSYKGDILLAKGRRIGATHIMGIKAIEFLMNNKNTHPSSQIVCVSLTEDQAELIIMFALEYANQNYEKYIGKGKDKPLKGRIIMVVRGNRRILLARPVGNTGDSVRGFQGQVLMVDEASRMPKLFWIAAKPLLLTTGGEIWMWSTFFGKTGYFWDRYDDKREDKRFKVFLHNSEDVIHNRPISKSWTKKQREDGIRILEQEKRDMTELEYGQEYLALALDDLQRYFPEDLIEKCCIKKRRGMSYRNNYLGVDVARLGGDHNAYVVVNNNGHIFSQVESISEPGKLMPETERDIIKLAELWKPKKIGVDAGSGSLGVSIYDHLRETKWKSKMVAMNNRALVMDDEGKKLQKLNKEDYYGNLKSMMEHGEILLLNDNKVKDSLRSVQEAFVMKNEEPTKREIFSNPHSESHIVEALVRAAYLAKKEKALNLWIRYN